MPASAPALVKDYKYVRINPNIDESLSLFKYINKYELLQKKQIFMLQQIISGKKKILNLVNRL
jgi:hypothetical protein